MEEEEFISKSTRETEKLGSTFSKKLKAGEIVLLTGPLGAGKTAFVRGIAAGLNIKSRIMSPTFVLVRKHRLRIMNHESGIKNLYHIDLYRLEGLSDMNSLGLDDIFQDENGIFLIEWGEKHEELKGDWALTIEVLEEDKRKIKIKQGLSSPT